MDRYFEKPTCSYFEKIDPKVLISSYSGRRLLLIRSIDRALCQVNAIRLFYLPGQELVRSGSKDMD